MSNDKLAVYLHSWQVKNKTVDEIKQLLSTNIPNNN